MSAAAGRLLLALGAALVLTLLLFLMMQRMVLREGGLEDIITSERLVEFVRDPREETWEERRQRREPPEPPPPPPEPVQTPRLELEQPPLAALPRLDIPMPRLDLGPLEPGVDPAITNGVRVGETAGGVAGGGLGDGGDVIALVRVQPQYPSTAARRGIEGWVRVAFSITEEGTVTDIEVLEAEPRRVFERAAVQAISRWRFKPRLVNGEPVRRDGVVQTISFSLHRDS